jgi:hypothetical protein
VVTTKLCERWDSFTGKMRARVFVTPDLVGTAAWGRGVVGLEVAERVELAPYEARKLSRELKKAAGRAERIESAYSLPSKTSATRGSRKPSRRKRRGA